MDEGRTPTGTRRVDVNSASAETLNEVVDGLGPVLAERIVAYRQAHGPFTALEQLVAVQGIGPRSLQLFIDQLALGYQATIEDRAMEVAAEPEQVDELDDLARELAAETQQAAEPPRAEPEWAEPILLEEERAMPEVQVEASPSAPIEESALAVATTTGAEPTPGDMAFPEQAEDEEEEPLATAEDVAKEAAESLEAELAGIEMEELSLYTRKSAEETLSPWTPATRAEGGVSMAFEAQEAQEPAQAESQDLAGQRLEPPVEASEPPVEASEPPVEASEPPVEASEPQRDVTHDTLEATGEGAGQRRQIEPPVIEPAQDVRGEEGGTMAQEAAALSAPVGAKVEKQEVREVRRGSFWRGLGLVLLGGLLGVILTLVAAIIWSGTVDFAPRQEVNALSRNLNTMQANQELAWERVDQLTVSAQELGRQVEKLQALSGQVTTLEQGLQAAQADLAAAQSALDAMSEGVAALEKTLESGLNSLDERVTTTEDQIGTMGATVDGLKTSVDTVQERMTSFDTFFTALRDLLIDMQGGPAAISGAQAEPAPTEAP